MNKEKAVILANLLVTDWRKTYNRQPPVIITGGGGMPCNTRTISDVDIVRRQLDFYGRNPELFKNFVKRCEAFTHDGTAQADFLAGCREWCDTLTETA